MNVWSMPTARRLGEHAAPWQHASTSTRTQAVEESPVNHVRAFEDAIAHQLDQVFKPLVTPTPDEFEHKELIRRSLENMLQNLSPGCRLIPFGSSITRMCLKNADMDLCFVASPLHKTSTWAASKLVREIGWMIRRRAPASAQVELIARARVPIIKIFMPLHTIIGTLAGRALASSTAGYHFDISFSNQNALHNTRLLWTYGRLDERVITIAMFFKLWAKRRKLNDSRSGTLNSYALVIMVLHFMINVAQPPVLPNLQTLGEHHPPMSFTHYLDDVPTVLSLWQTRNTQSTGGLLRDLFFYYAYQFPWEEQAVIAIRVPGGLIERDTKIWDSTHSDTGLYMEDPIETGYNVTKSSTQHGIELFQREMDRAAELLSVPRDVHVTLIFQELLADPYEFRLPQPTASIPGPVFSPSPWQQQALYASPTISMPGARPLPKQQQQQQQQNSAQRNLPNVQAYDLAFPKLG